MYLPLWARHIEGARSLLLRLKDDGVLLFSGNGVKPKEREVYSNAMYECLLHDKSQLGHYMMQDGVGRFYDHVRDKKGRLVDVKFAMFKPQILYKRL